MIRTFESTPPADNVVAWQLEVQEDEDWRVICAGPPTRSITGSIPDDAKLVRIRWGVKGGGPLLDGDVIQLQGEAATLSQPITLLVTVKPSVLQVGNAFTIVARAIGTVSNPVLTVDWWDEPIRMSSVGGGRYQAVLVAHEPGRYTPEVRCEDPPTRASITFDVLP